MNVEPPSNHTILKNILKYKCTNFEEKHDKFVQQNIVLIEELEKAELSKKDSAWVNKISPT